MSRKTRTKSNQLIKVILRMYEIMLAFYNKLTMVIQKQYLEPE